MCAELFMCLLNSCIAGARSGPLRSEIVVFIHSPSYSCWHSSCLSLDGERAWIRKRKLR